MQLTQDTKHWGGGEGGVTPALGVPRTSPEAGSLGNLKPKQQAKLSGELLWMLHVPEKLQLRLFIVSWDWPGFEVNIKASWGQRKPKGFHPPPFFCTHVPALVPASAHWLWAGPLRVESTTSASRFVQVKAEHTSRMEVWTIWPTLSDKAFCSHKNPLTLTCCFLFHAHPHWCWKCPFLRGFWRQFLVSARPWRCRAGCNSFLIVKTVLAAKQAHVHTQTLQHQWFFYIWCHQINEDGLQDHLESFSKLTKASLN